MTGPASAWGRLRQLFRGAAKPDAPDPVPFEGGESDESADDSTVVPDPPPAAGPGRRDRYYTSGDGLRLHVAEYGDTVSPWLPVVCIPGLSRNARDFEALALHLAAHPTRPRRVLAFDLRGRGKSDWDGDIAHYSPLIEMQDVLDGMAALGVDRAVILGTSRGGLIAMLMGVARPSVIAGIVLNDVGPALEPRGLARLKTYIGRTPAPDDWSDAAHILRRLHGHQFTALDDDAWATFARMTWRDEDGMPVGDYDPALARTFDGIEFDQPLPTLWREFAALSASPVLAIRGENSDILSAETLDRMAREHPRLDRLVVAGQGHAPLLIRDALLRPIADFVAAAEGEDGRGVAGPPAPRARVGGDPATPSA